MSKENIEKKAVTDTSDTHLLDMLLEAINYVYGQLDGKYGNLSYVVSDKVKYIERVRAEKNEQKKREEFEARERGEAKPEADVDKWAVTNAFLHCDKAGKIVSEMYGDKFNNQRNRDKYLAFLGQVNLDDRFGELAEILQRYGAMPAPKEQPEADLEAEIERWWNERYAKLKKDYKFDSTSGHYLDNETIIALARHFAEWGRTQKPSPQQKGNTEEFDDYNIALNG